MSVRGLKPVCLRRFLAQSLWYGDQVQNENRLSESFEGKPSARGWRRLRVKSVGVILLMGGFSLATAPAAVGSTVNTFHLSGDLHGTLVLKPAIGCGDPGYLEEMQGHVTGEKKGVTSWTLAINQAKPGTYKASDSLNSKAHVTLDPAGLNAITNTLVNVSGTLKVTGADASSGSVNLKMATDTDKVKATLVGSWSCPPASS